MTHKTLVLSDLAQFIGTENWYRHALMRNIVYTDGAKYVADHASAYWLLDEIALTQLTINSLRDTSFQVWKLIVHADQTAKLICEDGNERMLFSKNLTYTDFPLDEITFYFTEGVILLPSEY